MYGPRATWARSPLGRGSGRRGRSGTVVSGAAPKSASMRGRSDSASTSPVTTSVRFRGTYHLWKNASTSARVSRVNTAGSPMVEFR